MRQGVLKEDQPRQGKSENGGFRGTEGVQKKTGMAPRTCLGLAEIGVAPATVDGRAERVESKKPMRGASVEAIDAGGQDQQQGGQKKALDRMQKAFAIDISSLRGQ